MFSGFSYLPANETPERKQAALKRYAEYFGEEVPTSSDLDARYIAAVVAMTSEIPATPKDVRDFEECMAAARKKTHAD